MKQFATDEEYYGDWKYVTNSQLGYLKKGWEYYLMMKQGGKVDSLALRFGNLVHTLILEPKEYQNKFIVFNKEDRPDPSKTMLSKLNRGWKDKVEFDAKNSGKILLTMDQYQLGLNLRDKLVGIKNMKKMKNNKKN